MTVRQPEELHRATETAFNRGDVDVLVSLYAPGASLVDQDGSVACGADAIRDVWAGFASLGGHITMTTRHCVVSDDLALLSNAWHFVSADLTFDGVSAEVAVRGPDGYWRYFIDHPTGGVAP